MARKTQYEGFSPSLRTTAIFVFGLAVDSSTDRPADAIVADCSDRNCGDRDRKQPVSHVAGLLTRTPWASRKALVDDLSKDQALPCTQHVSTVLKSLCEVYFKNSWRSFDSPKRMCAPYYLAVRFIYPSQIACRIIARACKRKQGGN